MTPRLHLSAFFSAFLWQSIVGITLVFAALLVACGGGNVAGVGSGGSGLAQGSVSGFGSVIVDGVEYDNSAVTAQQTHATGQLGPVELKLGQQVRMVYTVSDTTTAAPVAISVQVLPLLQGPVTSALDRNGWMQVMGQWVRVVKRNDDISRLGSTKLAGYTADKDIAIQDEVLVHGAWGWDGSKSAYVLVATLIDKAATASDPVQLSGVVQQLSGMQFRLNTADGLLVQASTLPEGVVNGQVVQFWATRATLANAVSTGQVLTVGAVSSDTSTLSTALAGRQQATLSGQATAYDPVARRVQVQGIWVQLSNDMAVDTAALARGEFVSLKLQPVTGGGSPVASRATLRPDPNGPTDLGASTVLKGNLTGIDWRASPVAFTLRGSKVLAPTAAIAAGCSAFDPTATVYVQVVGTLPSASDVVTAASVTCSAPQPPPSPKVTNLR